MTKGNMAKSITVYFFIFIKKLIKIRLIQVVFPVSGRLLNKNTYLGDSD